LGSVAVRLVESMTGDGQSLSAEGQRWDGETGEKWVRNADRLDKMLSPFSDAILSASAGTAYDRPLDIGCGAGALTLRLADGSAEPTGVDVSSPLIALARQRASDAAVSARFLLADASTYQPDLPHDLLVSRFGVMFFEDSVAAFAHLRRAAREGAPLHFVCWQEPKKNPWASLPAQIAKEQLGIELPQPDPEAPGPFALASKDRLRAILTAAGWKDVSISSLSRTIAIPGNNPEEASRFLIELGPLARYLSEAEVPIGALAERLTAALPSAVQGGVSLPSEAWHVAATA
jgi:SAM-dependent methyltransferase